MSKVILLVLLLCFIGVINASRAYHIPTDAEIDQIIEMSDSGISSGAQLATTTNLNIREGPCTDRRIVSTLSTNTVVTYTGQSINACGHTWYSVRGNFGSGFASSQFLRQTSSPVTPPVTGGSSFRNSAAQWAISKVGSCYSQANRLGNPCYDCSSLVHLAYRQAGKTNVPMTTRLYPNSAVREVSRNEVAVGDILWREGHVGMFVGNGQVVNAENPQNGVRMRSFSSFRFTKVYRVL